MMYIYRAISDDIDKVNLKTFGEIRAREIADNNKQYSSSINAPSPILENAPSPILEGIAWHIAKASTGKVEHKHKNDNALDCWISTCKSIRPCLTEFALPQVGTYNTAIGRKDIAVIDVSYWNNNVKDSNECYTIFKSNDVTLIEFEYYIIYLGEKPKDIPVDCFRLQQMQSIRNLINSHYITEALFDCSFTSRSGRDMNRWDIMKFSGSNGKFKLFDRGLTGINNGTCANAQEVLCFNKIPQSTIKAILTPVQQDIIYMAKNTQLQNIIIDGLIHKSISIEWADNNIGVKVGDKIAYIAGKSWMYPGLIYEELDKIGDIEIKYKEYIEEKKNTVKKALLFILSHYNQSINDDFSLLEEDALKVYDFDSSNRYGPIRIEKAAQLYDIVAIKYQNELYTILSTKHNDKLIGTLNQKNPLLMELKKSGMLEFYIPGKQI